MLLITLIWRKAKSTSRDYKYHKAKTTHSTYLLQDFHELIFPKILKSVLIYGCKNYIWNHYNKHKCKSIKIYPVHISSSINPDLSIKNRKKNIFISFGYPSAELPA